MKATRVVAFLLLILLCIVPVMLVVLDSFVAEDGGLTLSHYTAAFAPPHRMKVLWTSVRLAFTSTLLALLLGIPYALFVTRVKMPLRSLFSALYVLPLILPPLLMTMGWTQFVRGSLDTLGLRGAEQVLGGVGGASFLFGLAYFPFVVLFARKAFLEIGAGLEEAARTSAGPLGAFLRITVPLAAPAILAGALFVFLFSIADFSVVDYLSTIFPPKERVNAYTFEAFSAWSTNWELQADRREAAALSLPIAMLSLVLLGLIYRLIRKGRFVTVTSGHVRPGFIEEGAPGWLKALLRIGGLVFCTVVLALSVGVPIGRTIREAMGTDGDFFGNVRRALVSTGEGAGGGLPDLVNSLLFAGAAGLVMTALAVVLADFMVRRGPRMEALVLSLSFLPLAFGPILFGAGLIRTWNHAWLEVDRFNYIYDTPAIVVLMLAGKYLPFALAAVWSSMKRIDPGYEEAAATSGVGWVRRLLGVVTPLAWKGIVAGFILGFVFSLRELDTIVLISAGNRTAMMKIYTWVHTAYEANVAALSLVLTLVIGLPFVLYSLLTSRRVKVL